jgi:cytochrome oxidase Cu insertion factor (SCO1/SenC/PrrC family)
VTEIGDVTQRYGIYVKKRPAGDVDHTFHTSLIDREGILRVQYQGVRLDPDEFLGDLRSLLRERHR